MTRRSVQGPTIRDPCPMHYVHSAGLQSLPGPNSVHAFPRRKPGPGTDNHGGARRPFGRRAPPALRASGHVADNDGHGRNEIRDLTGPRCDVATGCVIRVSRQNARRADWRLLCCVTHRRPRRLIGGARRPSGPPLLAHSCGTVPTSRPVLIRASLFMRSSSWPNFLALRAVAIWAVRPKRASRPKGGRRVYPPTTYFSKVGISEF